MKIRSKTITFIFLLAFPHFLNAMEKEKEEKSNIVIKTRKIDDITVNRTKGILSSLKDSNIDIGPLLTSTGDDQFRIFNSTKVEVLDKEGIIFTIRRSDNGLRCCYIL